MFCTQICGVGIITGSYPVHHSKWVRRDVWWESTAEATARKQKDERRCETPLVLRTTYFSVSCTDSKYLAFPSVLLTWTCDLPLVSDDSPMVPCSRLPGQTGSRLVIHRLLDHLPQCIDFCFPPISWREAKKRLKTLSVWSWIRILHRGDTLGGGGSQFVYLFIGLTLPCPEILPSIRRNSTGPVKHVLIFTISGALCSRWVEALGHTANKVKVCLSVCLFV